MTTAEQKTLVKEIFTALKPQLNKDEAIVVNDLEPDARGKIILSIKDSYRGYDLHPDNPYTAQYADGVPITDLNNIEYDKQLTIVVNDIGFGYILKQGQKSTTLTMTTDNPVITLVYLWEGQN